ncbi:MAG TPA: hypothetical protein ENN17_07225 [bacterium]|nr:hypothetical protein [bacterium]
MPERKNLSVHENIFRFNRDTFGGTETFTYLGDGERGGKAQGLALIQESIIPFFRDHPFPSITVYVPKLLVITTHFFDLFLKNNDLYEIALSGRGDDRIAHRFQKAELPSDLVGDLRAFNSIIHSPLAVRSSSLLEDQAHSPFAGVYETKMIPNNQPDPDSRFNRLVEAVKFVWASTFFRNAKAYRASVNQKSENEKMAVIIQEIAGQRHGDRFYPNVSGVARSFNFFPFGHAAVEDGIVNLALGLGKTIMDGNRVWSYSPASPGTDPPFSTTGDLLKQTQKYFWAVNMGKPPAFDPIRETEYLIQCSLTDAEYDNTLSLIASTYDAENDMIKIGTGTPGPRILTFSPLRQTPVIPFNDVLSSVVKQCEEAVGEKVEIEFAVNFERRPELHAAFSLLQVRPIVLNRESTVIQKKDLSGENVLLASERVLGYGVIDSLKDIVYIRPENFDIRYSREIAEEIEIVNSRLVKAGRRYLLIGFGRWGSTEAWLGIPVNWGQISGARVIVEATLPEKEIDLSQGYHFFHNISSLGIGYFSLKHTDPYRIDWDWLDKQRPVSETRFVRHVQSGSCIRVILDAGKKMGVILT